tara:strand:- start:481 stop:687 length:207 start_codon:yes stop_codon:yes gene_type:complete
MYRDYMTLIYSLLVDPPLPAARTSQNLQISSFLPLPLQPAARNGQNLQVLLTFTFTCTNPQESQEILR